MAGHIVGSGYTLNSFADVGSGMIDGMAFWNHLDDLGTAGQGFMGDVLTFSPLIAKVPNPTAWSLKGPFMSGEGLTLLRVDNLKADYPQRFRLDIGRLPKEESVPRLLRGKVLPHWHSRARGRGIGWHRPWQK